MLPSCSHLPSLHVVLLLLISPQLLNLLSLIVLGTSVFLKHDFALFAHLACFAWHHLSSSNMLLTVFLVNVVFPEYAVIRAQ